MGELVMTKNEGRLEFLDESIRFVAENGGIMKTDEFVAKEQQAHPGMDTTSCYHKIVMARYFGLVLYNKYSSYYFLTEAGTNYSRARSQNEKIDAILKALTSVTFGRNNNAVSSDSDIEAPVVMLKAVSAMDSASMTQIGLILYYMDAENKTLTEAIDIVQKLSNPTEKRQQLTANKNSKYFDVKFNKLFEELGIVTKEQNDYVLSQYVKDRHLEFINQLPEVKPIISSEKTEVDVAESTNQTVIADDIKDNYSIDELGSILTQMYNTAENKTTAVHMFGLKYGEIITRNSYSAVKLVNAAEIPDSYHVEVNKGTAIYKSIKDNEYGISFATEQEINEQAFDYNDTKGMGINKIFYGTPGCGKSFYIDHDILGKSKESKQYEGDYDKENIIRTTFYQDYSNTDFVGQILPKIEKDNKTGKETVKYIFNPGPFTLALIRAICNPKKKVALVVEEINRGNAPAIFGDIFQLLDRDANGISEYGILNVSILDYLNDYVFDVDGKNIKYIFNEIKIPGNMDIFATMNTSDQNVYTLDTAFVRRWDKEKIKNSFQGCDFATIRVPGMNYTWQEFVTAINKHIAKHLEDLQVNEDKQIGVFFIKESLLESTPKKFAYKVFDYLWSDVAKLDHGIFFNHFDTLEALITAYEKDGVGVFKTGIFDKKETPQTVEEDENNE